MPSENNNRNSSRPGRPQSPRPAGRPFNPDRPRPPRDGEDRPKPYGNRDDRPKPYGDRPARPPYQGDRPKPYGDRPARPPYQGDRPKPYGDRPARPPYQGDRPRPPRRDDDRPPRQFDRDNDRGRPPRQETSIGARPGWGSLTRKGANAVVNYGDRDLGTDEQRLRETPPPEFFEERFEQVADDSIRDEAGKAVRRATGKPTPRSQPDPNVPTRQRASLDQGTRDRIVRAVGKDIAGRFAERLVGAAEAYAHDRFGDAMSVCSRLAKQAPSLAEVRELWGLSLYRMGRWKEALRELELYESLEQTVDQSPVIMDCLRALRRYDELEDRWGELRSTSPSPELIAEGRIVMAGSFADRGRFPDAIRAMEVAAKAVKKPQMHHLRMWYVLADLYERAGDPSRAKTTFRRLADVEPAFADVNDRIKALS